MTASSSSLNLPPRQGPKPKTTQSIPHSQIDQHGPDAIVHKLYDYAFSLPHVNNEPSGISVRGARALVVHENCACNKAAFMTGREFAHIHPRPDHGSMHLVVSAQDAEHIVQQGWGEDHFLVGMGYFAKGLIMVFSPRDERELEVIQAILKRSHDFANPTSGTTV